MKVSELEGVELDAWVAKAMGWRDVDVPPDFYGDNSGKVLAPPGLSSSFSWAPKGRIPYTAFLRQWHLNWQECGPMIERFRLHLFPLGALWGARHSLAVNGKECVGETPQLAICRAVVAGKFGDEVPQ